MEQLELTQDAQCFVSKQRYELLPIMTMIFGDVNQIDIHINDIVLQARILFGVVLSQIILVVIKHRF